MLRGGHVQEGTLELAKGSIHICENVRIESHVLVKDPRSGTCVRGDVLFNLNVVLRGEVKNSVILDDAELCHPLLLYGQYLWI